MATGLISTGMHLDDYNALSTLLLALAAGFFVVLLILTGWRLLAHRDAVLKDFTDPGRGFGFFTLIAATNVLGVRLAMDGHQHITAALLVFAGVLWLVLGYVIPGTAVLGAGHRPVVAGANGTWFIWVVASQSVAVSSASLEPVFSATRDLLAVVAVFSWSVGTFLYAAAGIFVAARMMLYELRPTDLIPPYWVAMGACAITVLAGARIVEMADAPMVNAARGLIAGASVMFWAFATWLIPPLVAAGWWRHHTHRVPLAYESAWWSIIFPLGMYAVAGIYLGQADDLPIVGAIGSNELWVAFAAWTTVLVAMAVHLVRTILLSVTDGSPQASTADPADREKRSRRGASPPAS